MTCAGVGLQPWRLEWTSEGLPIESEAITSNLEQKGSLYFSVNLIITKEFAVSDAAAFSCFLQIDEFTQFQIKTVSLRAVLKPFPTPVSHSCSAFHDRTFFQIRILGVRNCGSWREESKFNISRDFELALRGAIAATCEDCPSPDEVIITSTPRCSVAVGNAIAFWGRVVSQNVDNKNRLFCSLSSWQQSSPEIKFLNDNKFYLVDHSCPLEINSSSATGCEIPSRSLIIIFISGATVGAPILGVLVLALYIGILFLQCRRVWRKRYVRMWVPVSLWYILVNPH